MKEFQNNAYFWQKLDTLCLSGDFVETRAKGEVHPSYPNLIYPCRYGYFALSEQGEDKMFHAFVGSEGSQAVGVVICADILAKDLEVKVLIGVSEKEEEAILDFLNQTDFQKTVIMKRGKEIPSWAVSD